MNMTTLWKLGGSALLAGALLSMTWASAPGSISVGDEVSYSFRKQLTNGMGAKSLADFAGKPVLVEFWGTR